jgi:hypothetical protein
MKSTVTIEVDIVLTDSQREQLYKKKGLPQRILMSGISDLLRQRGFNVTRTRGSLVETQDPKERVMDLARQNWPRPH